MNHHQRNCEMQNEQQNFWRSDFGMDYIGRNQSEALLSSNLHLFSQILEKISLEPKNILEFGANVGMNLKALKLLVPNSKLSAIEINEEAFLQLKSIADQSFCTSIEEYEAEEEFDLVFTKGVLIHIAPENLESVYEKIYKSAGKHILIVEYYNPEPVSIDYRGHKNKLFKRDFAGDLLNLYQDLRLSSYGFIYRNGPFPQDDLTWFLLQKS